MPTGTENVEVKQIVTNLEKFICITAVANPEALRLEEAATGGVQ